eukprot:260191-Amphidinium_carterae.3
MPRTLEHNSTTIGLHKTQERRVSTCCWGQFHNTTAPTTISTTLGAEAHKSTRTKTTHNNTTTRSWELTTWTSAIQHQHQASRNHQLRHNHLTKSNIPSTRQQWDNYG